MDFSGNPTPVMDVDFNELLVNLFSDFNGNLMNICSECELQNGFH